jgi:methionyl-tRNA formyltransferase
LIQSLPDYLSGKNKGEPQKQENETYARKLTRRDGFIPWEYLQTAMEGNDIEKTKRIGISQFIIGHLAFGIVRMLRALSPWPGVWTLLRPAERDFGGQASSEKRLKILAAHVEHEKLILDTVQLEGKNPVNWLEFEKAYL